MSQTLKNPPLIGKAIERVDGRLKVTGRARYAAEFKYQSVTHGVLVMSTIANGRITGIDARTAEAQPGVIAVISHLNAPRLPFPEKRLPTDPVFGRTLRVLQEDTIYFNSQPVAVVVAETLEQAEHAATLVKISYDERNPSPAWNRSWLERSHRRKVWEKIQRLEGNRNELPMWCAETRRP